MWTFSMTSYIEKVVEQNFQELYTFHYRMLQSKDFKIN